MLIAYQMFDMRCREEHATSLTRNLNLRGIQAITLALHHSFELPMFGHFKNILPSGNFNVPSFSTTMGRNEEEWRERGLERLEAIRSSFQDLNAFFLNRYQDLPKQGKSEHQTLRELGDAGQLLPKLQYNWRNIHDKSLNNVGKGAQADKLLNRLLNRCGEHAVVSERMEKANEDLAAIHANLRLLAEMAVALKESLVTLEDQIDDSLFEFSRQEYDEWKDTQRVGFHEDFMAKRADVRQLEQQMQQSYEAHNSAQTKARVDLYAATFHAELEDYKRRREVEVSSLYCNKLPVSAPISSLESVRLDADADDLNDFFIDLEDDPRRTSSQACATSLLSSFSDQNQELEDISGDDEIEILGDEDYDDSI